MDSRMAGMVSRRRVLVGAVGTLAVGATRSAKATSPLRLSAVYAGGVTAPWGGRVHRAALEAEARGDVIYTWVEDVGGTDIPDAIAGAAADGADLVVADVFAAELTARNVSGRYPETAFLFGSSFRADLGAPNIATFDCHIADACFLAGIAAGSMTQTGRIGMVAGYPLHGVNRRLHAFAAGARIARPGVVFEVGFTGVCNASTGAEGCAKDIADRGADVVFGDCAGAWAGTASVAASMIGSVGDWSGGVSARSGVVASAVWNVGPTLQLVLGRIRSGAFRPEDLAQLSSMPKGGCQLLLSIGSARVLSGAPKDGLLRYAAAITAGRMAVSVPDHQPEAVFT